MKAARKHTQKLLLLGVLVALVSMAVSMDVFGMYMSRQEKNDYTLSRSFQAEEPGFRKVEMQLPVVFGSRGF